MGTLFAWNFSILLLTSSVVLWQSEGMHAYAGLVGSVRARKVLGGGTNPSFLVIGETELMKNLGDVLASRSDKSSGAQFSIQDLALSSNGSTIFYAEQCHSTDATGSQVVSTVKRAELLPDGKYEIVNFTRSWDWVINGVLILDANYLIVAVGDCVNTGFQSVDVSTGKAAVLTPVDCPLRIAKHPLHPYIFISADTRIYGMSIAPPSALTTLPSVSNRSNLAGPVCAAHNSSYIGYCADEEPLNAHTDSLDPSRVRFDWPLIGARAISTDGKSLYVADLYNNAVRRVNTFTGATETIAGNADAVEGDGGPSFAGFNEPCALAVTHDGCNLFVAERKGGAIRWLTFQQPHGNVLAVKTVALVRKSNDSLGSFRSLILSEDDNCLYAGTDDGQIFKIGVNHSALHQCGVSPPSASAYSSWPSMPASTMLSSEGLAPNTGELMSTTSPSSISPTTVSSSSELLAYSSTLPPLPSSTSPPLELLASSSIHVSPSSSSSSSASVSSPPLESASRSMSSSDSSSSSSSSSASHGPSHLAPSSESMMMPFPGSEFSPHPSAYISHDSASSHYDGLSDSSAVSLVGSSLSGSSPSSPLGASHENGSPGKTSALVVGLAAGLTAAVAVSFLASCIVLYALKQHWRSDCSSNKQVPASASAKESKPESVIVTDSNTSRSASTPAHISKSGMTKFTLAEIQKAIQEGHCLTGKGGGFGDVYRGSMEIENGKATVAIKVMRGACDEIKHKQFMAELNTIGQVRHKNLCQILGYCTEDEKYFLIYPFVSGGSLYDHLHSSFDMAVPTSEPLERAQTTPPASHGTDLLTWRDRMSIAQQVAEGLCYLHHSLEPPILHRDVKSRNVLLERVQNGNRSSVRALLTDFGLARPGIAAEDQEKTFTGEETVPTLTRSGTPGYMAPEYANGAKLTMKNDVFAFGVILMELITGQKAITGLTRHDSHPVMLYTLARKWLSRDSLTVKQLDEIMDPTLVPSLTAHEREMIHRAGKLACQCTDDIPSERPLMQAVVQQLLIIGQDRNSTLQ
ncbi:hypothetical protein CBR_g38317 [Chara braunii]|uniref:Protein kinase domain-containing protein n=1 Tax=Chara braunii TaxID=69332 RepID=A0A388LPS2_CHABU|nr:hypothetical protein CBR_g38317 [Chara braunii]|eukprot:GBG84346.1 hypothetical protein CBR_g38317 [Chara braunii]